MPSLFISSAIHKPENSTDTAQRQFPPGAFRTDRYYVRNLAIEKRVTLGGATTWIRQLTGAIRLLESPSSPDPPSGHPPIPLPVPLLRDGTRDAGEWRNFARCQSRNGCIRDAASTPRKGSGEAPHSISSSRHVSEPRHRANSPARSFGSPNRWHDSRCRPLVCRRPRCRKSVLDSPRTAELPPSGYIGGYLPRSRVLSTHGSHSRSEARLRTTVSKHASASASVHCRISISGATAIWNILARILTQFRCATRKKCCARCNSKNTPADGEGQSSGVRAVRLRVSQREPI